MSKLLVIFEMANNHGGDVHHGLDIIKAYGELIKPYRDKLDFGFKLQYRDLDTFIHPDYKERTDLKFIKRFKETKLTEDEFLQLRREMDIHGFIPICTPFDEISAQKVKQHNYQFIKIASCSLGDWPLIGEIGKTELPVIASTAGASLDVIDRVVTFFKHRKQSIALMHCIAEYPATILSVQLNQIDLLRSQYPDLTIGFSSHECPDSNIGTLLSIAKGATIIERHVGIDKNRLNNYSLDLTATQEWLHSITNALHACGVPSSQRYTPSKEELDSLHSLRRGMYTKTNITVNSILNKNNVFFAMPTAPGQLTANNFSKYSELLPNISYPYPNLPIMKDDVSITRCHDQLLSHIFIVHKMLQEAHIAIPNNTTVELSHHYGLKRFTEYGMMIINCINREYCKKFLILLPDQIHPEQYHKIKEETFHIIYGTVNIKLDGVLHITNPGDVLTVEREVRHEMQSSTGAIIEELSSTHINGDSYYTDPIIGTNLNRKTELRYFFG